MSIPEVPTYLTDAGSTEAAIRARLLDLMLAEGYDITEGEFAWDFQSPLANEASIIGIAMRFVLQQAFAQTAYGDYLTLATSERGIDRRPAGPASGVIRFTAPAGTVIPYHTIASTVATSTSPAQTFQTDAEATVPVGETTVDVAATAVEPGAIGNVAPGTVRLLTTSAPGVTAVTNPAAFEGGSDTESDVALLERYLVTVRSSSAGGNRADHIRWAMEVPGVGGANVSYPTEGSPAVPAGSVRVSIVDANRAPASAALIREVIDKVVDPVRLGPYEAEAFTVSSAFGVSTDATQVDDTGSSVLMVYNAGGVGMIHHLALNTLLTQPGIWQVKVRVKVSSAAGSANLLGLGVWNTSTAAYAPASPGGAPSIVYRAANALSTAFPDALYEDTWVSHDFYWNGSDGLRLEVVRAQADTTTQMWVDQVKYRSVFSDDGGEGLAPAGQRVEVLAASPVSINVAATLTIASGYTRSSVEDQIEANLTTYLRGLAFGSQNDVQYARVGTVILDTPGVSDYSGLTVNGGVGNVAIASEQVAVLGTATWS